MLSQTPFAIAASSLGGATIALILATAVAKGRKPKPGPPTQNLGPEPPAVVNLLINDFEVRRHAKAATLLDLTARRWIDMDWIGGQTLLRPRSRGHGAVSDYEQMVLDHVKTLAREGPVPAGALTTGALGASRNWWQRFAKAVIADASERGLCRPRRSKVVKRLVAWGSGLSWLLTIMAAPIDWEGEKPLLLPAAEVPLGIAYAVAGVLLVLSFWKPHGLKQLDTEEGLRAAGRWLGVREHLSTFESLPNKPAAAVIVWDRYMAYAVALGLAPRALRELPMDAEDDRRALSRATGRWREVRIRYPTFRPFWGWSRRRIILQVLRWAWPAVGVGAMAMALMLAIFRGVGGLVEEIPRNAWVRNFLLALTGYIAILLSVIAIAVADARRSQRVEGVVLRRRTFHDVPLAMRAWNLFGLGGDEDPDTGSNYWLAIDRGTSDRVTAWSVAYSIYKAVGQGGRVRVTLTPWFRYVRQIERLDEPSTRPEPPAERIEDLAEGGPSLPPEFQDRVRERLAVMTETSRPIPEAPSAE